MGYLQKPPFSVSSKTSYELYFNTEKLYHVILLSLLASVQRSLVYNIKLK